MDYKKMTTTELFQALAEQTKRMDRFKEANLPKSLIEFEQYKFDEILKELMKYMSPAIIEKEMETKWLQKKIRKIRNPLGSSRK